MKKYVCEGCHGKGTQEEFVMTSTTDFDFYEPVKLCPCALCVAKGYTPFIMAKTPEDDQLVDAVKKEVVSVVNETAPDTLDKPIEPVEQTEKLNGVENERNKEVPQ